MLRVVKPSIPTIDVYRACYKGIADVHLRNRLENEEAHVQGRSDEFDAAATDGLTFYLTETDFSVPTVSKSEMEWLYDERMVKRSAGRKIYETLRAAARDGLCAICGVRPAATLDHFLAKQGYHALAVNPLNLVPACFECNHTKGSAKRDTPHPYFDDYHLDVWLNATVVPTSPCVVEYSVLTPSSWSPSMATKVRNHFDTFKLGELYGAQAARHLAGIRQLLRQTLSAATADAVRVLLEGARDSWAATDLNCWETALYRALAISQWYCEGGFDN